MKLCIFDIKISVDKRFGIYQSRGWNFYIYLWKEVIENDFLSPPRLSFRSIVFILSSLSFFPFPFQVIYLRSTLKSLINKCFDETFTYVYWKSSRMIFYLLLFLFFARFPSLSKLFIYDQY